VIYLKVLSQHSPRETEAEVQETSSTKDITWLRFNQVFRNTS